MTTKVLRDEDRLIGASGGRKWPTIAFDISVSPPMVVTPDNRRMRIVENLLEEMKGWRNALAAHYMANFYDGAPDADDSPIPQR